MKFIDFPHATETTTDLIRMSAPNPNQPVDTYMNTSLCSDLSNDI